MAKKGESEKETAPAVQKEIGRSMSPFEEMDRMFERYFPRGWMRPMRWEWPGWSEMAGAFEFSAPKVDVIDRDDEILVRAEVPGVDKENLDVTVTDTAVTIKGSTRDEEKEEKGDYYRRELRSGSFARTVALPSEVDGDKARASFNDGVLELTLPKVAKSKKRTIKVE